MRTNRQTSNTLFRLGLVVLTVSSLICGYLHLGVVYMVGVPLLPVFIGLALVWVSPKPITKKLMSSLVPIPAALVGFALLYFSLPRAEPETFLIPSDFRGPFVIRFVTGCGDPIRYEDGRRIYKIPVSGALIHSGVRTLGVFDHRFYLVGPDGARDELPKFNYASLSEESDSLRWKLSQSELTAETVGVFWGYSNELSFFVSDHNVMARLSSAERQTSVSKISTAIDAELQRRNCKN